MLEHGKLEQLMCRTARKVVLSRLQQSWQGLNTEAPQLPELMYRSFLRQVSAEQQSSNIR
ncbi:Hypothetical protein OINT_2001228 [Brucella intermedia LMG 3301]|uniref:Uncharacterized protein n=1 Tax=Brucella intermedia LMG 3301 TaxID=641118 RepID=C4WNV0_9HYPH|nr:Hypothetical protein OINT_2001228 [Brucella intermedia LMG 3301]